MPNTAKNAATFVGEKILRIPFEDSKEDYNSRVTRGESIASAHHANAYIDREPTAAEWIKEQVPTKRDVASYLKSLFPFVEWLPRYNTQWLIGDLVAGITVGAVVVPQGEFDLPSVVFVLYAKN
jgi:sodium-independent sulfate anion transporter 11